MARVPVAAAELPMVAFHASLPTLASVIACRCLDPSKKRFAFITCQGLPMDGGFREMVVNGSDAALQGNADACFEIVGTGGSCAPSLFSEAVTLISGYDVVLGAGFNVKAQMDDAAARIPSSFFALVDVAFNGESTNNTQGMIFADKGGGQQGQKDR